jgi:hypothetical protein
MAVIPTMYARLAVISLVVLSISAAVVTFIFAPDFMQVDRVEIWVWEPAPGFPPGTMSQRFGGYKAIYGGPWYWGFIPAIVALVIALGISTVLADKWKLIRAIDD